MLLGNGDVGACVVVRPDALGIHIGKNDCWDIRVSEDTQAMCSRFGNYFNSGNAPVRKPNGWKARHAVCGDQVDFSASIRKGREFLRRQKVASPMAV